MDELIFIKRGTFVFKKKSEGELIIPRHIAFIMDGNGRWAQKRGLKRTAGHREGSQTLKKLIKDLDALGVEYATFYAFSTENWKRPEEEVSELMRLFGQYLDELEANSDNDFRICFIGDRTKLDETLQEKMARYEQASSERNGLCVCIAINYGGRDEITNAAKRICELSRDGFLDSEKITPGLFDSMLYTANIPPVDLLVRTGGEQRLSNFLLWQSAYAELYFCDTLWPDFNKSALLKAIKEFSGRNRRFGGLK